MRKQPVQFVRLISYLLFFTMVFSGCGGGGGGDTGGGGGNTPPSSGTGANGVAIFWQHYGSGMGAGNSVQETSDGGFILAGYDQANSTVKADGIVVKTDSKGGVQWQKTFGGSDWDMGNSVQQTTDGGYIAAGCINCGFGAPGPGSFYLLKLDPSGNKVWDKSISGSLLSGAYAVRETKTGANPDGYVFVGMDANQKVALIKTDLTGNVTLPSFASTGQGVGFAVEQTTDGGYVIAGDYAASSAVEMWLIKIDANRTIVWDKRFGAGEAFSVKQTADGGYILVGRTTVRTMAATITPGDAVVIKTDKDGNQVWRRTFGGAEDDEARSVALTLDGGYIIAGKTLSYGPGPVDYNQSWQWEDVFLIKLDANGNMVWGKAKGHRPNSSDGGASVFAVSDGGYIVTGNSNAYQSGTILLMKADNNGDTVNLGTEDLSVTVPSTIGIINFSNAMDVAAAGVRGFMLPHDVGSTSLDILIDVANGTPASAFCNGGGSYSVNPVAPVATGSVFTVSFTNCVNGPSGSQRTLNGPFTLKVDNLSGLLSSSTYAVQTTISSINITSTESGGTLTNTTTGSTRFSRQSVGGNYTELSQSITTPTPATLTYSETEAGVTRTRVVGPFTLSDSVTSGAFSLGGVGETATVTTASASGALTVTVLQPVQATGLGVAPSSGSFQITAQDNSRLTGTVTSGGVTLAIDTNADGTVDGTVATTWEFLY